MTPSGAARLRATPRGRGQRCIAATVAIMLAVLVSSAAAADGPTSSSATSGTAAAPPAARGTQKPGTAKSSCSVQVDSGQPGPALSSPVTLSPAAGSAQRIINFGTDRSPKRVQAVTLITDNPLPGDFNKAELNFDALLSRVSDTLESTDFPTPTFTVPQISADNRRITFDICLDPQGVAPGKYVGAITVGGPGGLSAGTVSLTVNAKAGSLFWIGGIISMVIAFLVLTLKGGEAEKTDSVSWGKAILKTFADLPWWATTLTALAAAFAALYAVYTDNPAWGAGGITDIVALIGAGFAAVGGQQILSTLTPTNH